MQVSVVKIGNSRGIRIPKSVLNQCHVDDTLELTTKNNAIILTPIRKKSREGWHEAAQLCHDRGDDALLVPASLPDDQDWEW